MPGEATRGDSPSPPSADELVFALCHEMGNLLAAVRLEAALLDHAAGAEALGRASGRLAEVAARCGSLLALVRPLLAPAGVEAGTTEPRFLLDGLGRGLDASCDRRVAIDVGSAASLPAVPLPHDLLHHLLLASIFAGLETSASPASPVRVAARASGSGIELLVDDGGPPDETCDAAPRGRALVVALARRLLAPHGARIGVSHADGRSQVTFYLPRSRR